MKKRATRKKPHARHQRNKTFCLFILLLELKLLYVMRFWCCSLHSLSLSSTVEFDFISRLFLCLALLQRRSQSATSRWNVSVLMSDWKYSKKEKKLFYIFLRIDMIVFKNRPMWFTKQSWKIRAKVRNSTVRHIAGDNADFFFWHAHQDNNDTQWKCNVFPRNIFSDTFTYFKSNQKKIAHHSKTALWLIRIFFLLRFYSVMVIFFVVSKKNSISLSNFFSALVEVITHSRVIITR